MNFFERLTDLRFVIGLFLITVGAVLLLAFAFGPSDEVQKVHLNLLAGLLMSGVGATMLMLHCSSFHSTPGDR